MKKKMIYFLLLPIMSSSITNPFITCECGSNLLKNSLYSHRKSQKHNILLSFQNLPFTNDGE